MKGFGIRLAAIALLALGLRLLYALVVMRHVGPSGDGRQFHLLAEVIAAKGEYLEPLRGPLRIPTAEKPPLFPGYLAVWDLVGAHSYAWHRAASCVLGGAMTVAVGLLGRRVDGERTGLIAAGLAAVYPMLVALDGSVRSESLYVLLIALVLLFAYRVRDGGSVVDAALLGILIGLAALTRSEALALLPLLALPVAWAAGAGRGRLMVAACVGLALAAGPWQVRNLLTFDRPVALTTNEGGLLAGANCEAAYYGDLIGNWPCYTPIRATRERDESDVSWLLRERALDYASDHAGRVPAVMGIRVLRTFSLWRPRQQAALDATESERNLRVQQVGVVCLWVLALMAIAGAVALRRYQRPLWPLVAPVVMVVLATALTWGAGRFRAAADVSFVVLAAVAVNARLRTRADRRRRTPAGSPSGTAEPTASA